MMVFLPWNSTKITAQTLDYFTLRERERDTVGTLAGFKWRSI